MLTVRSLIYHPAQLRGWAMLGLLLLVLMILSGMIWRNLARLESLGSYVRYSHRIQMANLGMQNALLEHIADNQVIDAGRLHGISEQVRALVRFDRHLDPQTPSRLLSVERSLADPGDGGDSPEASRTRLLSAMTQMSQALDEETTRRERMLKDLSSDTRYEVALASATLAAILLLAGLFLRYRILAPLNDLRVLLSRLAQEDFSPIDTERLDPLLLPVFNSYNDMVTRLAELEGVKRLHTQSLEAEVRAATRALLEQQRSLAQAERLAAVGELAAGIAHELRNPLAGIQMSCANLRGEVGDPEHARRLDLVTSELKRMARLLTDLLERGKQTPAPARPVALSKLVSELVALTRYQIPSHIELRSEVPSDLICRLPESNLRQALLNLVLNAAQAIDGLPGNIVIAARRESRYVTITVSDDGPGFSPELLANGIRSFTTSRKQGTGLGLAIVQRFVRDVGGHLALANRAPRGAEVTLQLPADEETPHDE
ncbi:MAG: two-component sensor histidine kinase [Gammaproteobacteria bacterium]|nr:two-component sensor histidine kinase [Gammaproteobacteria bacterium]